MDSFEDIVDLITAVLVMFLFTLIYFGQKQDTLVQSVVSIETKELADDVRSKGYLTKDMYESYLEKISDTDTLFTICMEHRQLVKEPEYRFRTPEEVIEEQDNGYTGSNAYTYHPVTTSKPEVNDPVNDGNLNTETNESILSSAVDIPADPNHVHSEECYGGHRHTGSQSFTHIHAHTEYCVKYTKEYLALHQCGNCGAWYGYFYYGSYWNPSKNAAVYSGGGYQYTCPSCGGGSYVKEEIHQSYGYSCGYDFDSNGDGYCEEVPVGVTHSYTKSYPQNNAPGTYTNGCYCYHIHSNPPGRIINYYGYACYNAQSIDAMISNGFGAYCRIPATVYLAFYTGHYTDYTYYIVYDITKVNGEYKLVYDKYLGSFMFNDGVFPTLTVSEYNALRKSTPSALYTYIWKYTGRAVDGPNSDSVVSYGADQPGRIAPGEILQCSSPENTWYASCGKTESGTLSCDKLVTSISPTNPVQTVAIGDPLITTVTATYQDGSKKVVVASTDFLAAEVIDSQTVTLTYTYTVNGVSYSRSCTITVTVIPRTKTCPNGHTYNLNTDGSDPGCPYCRAWLKSLELTVPSSGSITIFKGTSLSDNGITLLAEYLDGHREYLTSGYVDNLDKQYIGTQTVTIGYKGLYVNLTVITRRNLRLCPVCCRYYELYPDGSDPGCPYCQSLTPIFTGNVMEYYNERYTDDILKELYEGRGIYYFNKQDYLKITAKNIRGSWGSKLLEYFHFSQSNIQSVYGGYVRVNGYED